MFIPTHVALPFMRDKQIRVLGVAGRERSAAVPDIPTLHEQGAGRGRERPLVRTAGAGRNASRRSLRATTRAINEIIRTKEMIASLAKQGLVVSGGGPDVLRDLIVKDRIKWAKVIADAGIRAE